MISLFPLPKTVRSCSVSQGSLVCNTGCYIWPTQFTEVRTRNSCSTYLLCTVSPECPFHKLGVWSLLAPTGCVFAFVSEMPVYFLRVCPSVCSICPELGWLHSNLSIIPKVGFIVVSLETWNPEGKLFIRWVV